MAATNGERVEARYYERQGDFYKCLLCPHGCLLKPGDFGRCGARRADEDMLVAYSYGKVSSLCVDPVEKKPLFHYRPGSRCFSVGGIGCNMRCKHCQNYAISMLPSGKKRTTYEDPWDLVSMCRGEGMDCIAFTYNEPSIWFEYIMDVLERDAALDLILVTNGYINEEPLRELCAIADAVNMDVKGFTDSFYMQVCGAHLAPVLRSAEIVHEEGIHLELTYLVIPGYNDSDEEIRAFCEWVRDHLSEDVPVHFSRFHPDNEMMDVAWTPVETVLHCRDIGIDVGLHYVYVGNTLIEGADDTVCPECGEVVIERLGYLVDTVGLDGSRCSKCGHEMNIVPEERKQSEKVADAQHQDHRQPHRDYERYHRDHPDASASGFLQPSHRGSIRPPHVAHRAVHHVLRGPRVSAAGLRYRDLHRGHHEPRGAPRPEVEGEVPDPVRDAHSQSAESYR
jgi:pyruvate formate lyase activating enzyme